MFVALKRDPSTALTIMRWFFHVRIFSVHKRECFNYNMLVSSVLFASTVVLSLSKSHKIFNIYSCSVLYQFIIENISDSNQKKYTLINFQLQLFITLMEQACVFTIAFNYIFAEKIQFFTFSKLLHFSAFSRQ